MLCTGCRHEEQKKVQGMLEHSMAQFSHDGDAKTNVLWDWECKVAELYLVRQVSETSD